MMYKLENWSTMSDANPYSPPECIAIYLSGNVFGHPKWPNGHKIYTSSIIKVENGIVTTYSGSQYELGEPEAEFIEYCKTNGHYIPTRECPIKVMK